MDKLIVKTRSKKAYTFVINTLASKGYKPINYISEVFQKDPLAFIRMYVTVNIETKEFNTMTQDGWESNKNWLSGKKTDILGFIDSII